MSALRTPDGRYIVVRGRLWRATNPALPEDEQEHHTRMLMAARRKIKSAQEDEDPTALKQAREAVDAAKHALGERGDVWWQDGAPDYNRHLVNNTPYAEWYRHQGEGSN